MFAKRVLGNERKLPELAAAADGELEGCSGWRRRESNPGPEPIQIGVYVRIPRFEVSQRFAPVDGLSSPLAILCLVTAADGAHDDQSVQMTPRQGALTASLRRRPLR